MVTNNLKEKFSIKNFVESNVGQTERVVSLVSGLVMAAIGLTNRSREGVALAIAGGALIIRGASGYCPVNAMLGRDSVNGGLEKQLH